MTRSLARVAAVAGLALLAALHASGAAAGDDKRAPAPRIRVEPEGFDFGRAQQNKTLRKEFTLRNFGEAQLVIEGVSTTCGCTAAITADTHVEPGGSTQLRVTLQTRSYSGKVERQVLVRSNDPQTPLLSVKVSAMVEKAGNR
jgi:Protein of unknown function (DUF1573)